MIEILRKRRNVRELDLCYLDFGLRLKDMLAELETGRWRPRLQETWRSNAEQERKWAQGLSTIRGNGPHTYTILGGKYKASLASHVLDDTDPTGRDANRAAEWFALLAVVARRHKLQTGLTWGLARDLHREKMELAIDKGMVAVLKLLVLQRRGFDPLHVEHPDWKRIMGKAK